MTQSDTSGQSGPARRTDGPATSTETVAKPGGTGSSETSAAKGASATPAKDAERSGATRNGSATSATTPAKRSGAGVAGGTSSSPLPGGASAGSDRGRSPARDDASRKPRRARLRLTQVDAWTVMKTSFLLAIALGIVSVVAVAVIWTVLGVAGVFDSLNDTVQTVLGNDFRLQDYIGTGRVLGFTLIVAVVNVVLLTAIATLAAFLYNLAATLLGGVEVTLTEDR